MTFNSELLGERRNTAESKVFNVSILPSVLKTTAKTHFVIKGSTFLSIKQQNLFRCFQVSDKIQVECLKSWELRIHTRAKYTLDWQEKTLHSWVTWKNQQVKGEIQFCATLKVPDMETVFVES